MSAATAEIGRVAPGALGRRLLWAGLAAAVLAIGLAALALGRYPIPVSHVLGILGAHVVPVDMTWTETEQRVVELIRLPRVLLAALVGAGLSACGAALQGVFRNPLVGPDIVGVSAGASFGGALAILLAAGNVALVGGAFASGMLAMAIAYLLARVGGTTQMLTLVLAGVVTGAFFSALVSLVTYIADPQDSLPAIVYWLMGSFAFTTYSELGLFTLVLIAAGAPLMAMRFRINVLSLGDEEASALGIRVELTRWLVLACVTAITATSVAVAGVVGWVGLVVPHIARMLVGPDHRVLLPAAGLIGAGYLIAVDTVARAAIAAEIPLGILTAVMGAPAFGLLLRRVQGRGWQG